VEPVDIVESSKQDVRERVRKKVEEMNAADLIKDEQIEQFLESSIDSSRDLDETIEEWIQSIKEKMDKDPESNND
jgi:prophage DNA circulation protein